MTKNSVSSCKRLLALALALCLLASVLPLPAAAAAELPPALQLTEGEILEGFAAAGTVCVSDDPSVAWVDESGALRALREGQTTVTVGESSYEVNVSDYDDGSGIVGQLKLVARFNDAMQFYDGHVYLIFTSYQDGVRIAVDDLYGGYEISELYYYDIREDISAGSNHTGSDADKYFSFRDDMKAVTLNRGELVTIGMYRAFELSVPQAALGSVTNSTLWESLSAALKTTVIEKLLSILGMGPAEAESALAALLAELQENGIDYAQLLDGTVGGGICFNRELYNQKLEWDQYENATYELDITANQLQRLTAALAGNLNQFSILKNSCATVALRAWNEAVGTRDGANTAYRLEPSGEGIFTLIDAPKTVKAEIVSKLPGHYLNKSDSTPEELEPNAGYYDETGWVYVSAPERIPLEDQGIVLSVGVRGEADAETSFYYMDAGEPVELPQSERTALAPGTEIFVRSVLSQTETDSILAELSLNGVSILDSYDEAEGVYRCVMPARSSVLTACYRDAELRLTGGSGLIQLFVGDTLDVDEHTELRAGDSPVSGAVRWSFASGEAAELLTFADETQRVCNAVAPGVAILWAVCKRNENIRVPVAVEVLADREQMVRVSFNEENADKYLLVAESEEGELPILFSGYYVPKGAMLRLVPTQEEPVVVSAVKANGRSVGPDETILLDEDTELNVKFRRAAIKGMPEEVRLASQDDRFQLEASVRYSGLAALLPVYDPSIRFESSDPILSVDETGLLTVAGEIPEEGKLVVVTARAGSGNGKVWASTRVILGDYAGSEIVGRLTIWARTVYDGQLVAHGAVAFTSYEDIDLDVSYYHYYKPSQEYLELMGDYALDPDSFPGDPAVYTEELDLGDRQAWFEDRVGGVEAAPQPVHLDAGDSFTVSNYSYDSTMMTVLNAFLGGEFASSQNVQALAMQLAMYMLTGQLDGPATFDSLAATLEELIQTTYLTGENPANGRAAGGQDLNREIYNQFRRPDTQLPNNYYTVELTADELAVLRQYLADPSNNYYALFTKNCGGGSVDLWNTVLADRPALRLNANLTGLSTEPESLYLELGLLRLKTGLSFDGSGEGGGKDYIPHAGLRFRDVTPELPFVDVSAEDPFYDAVAWAYYAEPQITAGIDETHFGVGTTVERGQAMCFLWAAAGKPEPALTEHPFEDVIGDVYFRDPVLWAVNHDPQITSGVDETHFGPGQTLNRGMMILFLYAAQGKPETALDPATENPFSDTEGCYWRDAAVWAYENGIELGENGQFCGDDPCPRELVVLWLYRALAGVDPAS